MLQGLNNSCKAWLTMRVCVCVCGNTRHMHFASGGLITSAGAGSQTLSKLSVRLRWHACSLAPSLWQMGDTASRSRRFTNEQDKVVWCTIFKFTFSMELITQNIFSRWLAFWIAVKGVLGCCQHFSNHLWTPEWSCSSDQNGIKNICQGKKLVNQKKNRYLLIPWSQTPPVLFPHHLKNWHDVHKAPLSVFFSLYRTQSSSCSISAEWV